MATNPEASQTAIRKPVRTQWYDRPEKVEKDWGPMITQQHFADEVNINNIVKKFLQTGSLPVAQNQAEFGYASEQTFTEAMIVVSQATEEFQKLPSHVRKHFENDTALYLDAASDPSKRHVFEELGLLEAITPPKPETAPTEPPATPAAPESAPA